jgi:hypothetical protein
MADKMADRGAWLERGQGVAWERQQDGSGSKMLKSGKLKSEIRSQRSEDCVSKS